ncbi:MAG: hypothetical protein AAF725_22495, partial [Acidobacteriota bacterium]
RALTVTGAAATVWLASAATGWSWWLRGLAGAVVLLLADAVRVGLTAGNVSAAAIGAIVLGLTAWRAQAGAAAVSLGLSLAFKPIAVLMPPLFMVYGLALRDARARRIALGSVAVTAVALLPGVRHLLDMLGAVSGGAAGHPRNLTLGRMLYCFGLEPPPLLVTGAIFALAGLAVFRWRPEATAFAQLTLVASLLALPIVWIYTLLLALPLQMTALARLSLARRLGRSLREPVRLLAALGVIGLFFAHAAGAVDAWPLWLQGLVMAVPVLSPAYLWAYCHLLEPAPDSPAPEAAAG